MTILWLFPVPFICTTLNRIIVNYKGKMQSLFKTLCNYAIKLFCFAMRKCETCTIKTPGR